MILFILAVLIIGALVANAFRHTDRKSGYADISPRGARFILPAALLALYLFVAIICVGIAYDDSANIKNSAYVIEQLEDQRDDLALVLKDTLSSDEYVRLIEASVPADVKFLRTNPQVSDFMLGRADRVVAINKQLFAEQNHLLDEARSVCNYVDNPMIPKIPFVGPDCTLGTLQDSFKVTTVEDE